MTIDEKKAKLSEHKKSIELLSNQWGCDKPVRTNATSPTFGKVVVLFIRPWQNPNNAGIRETAAGKSCGYGLNTTVRTILAIYLKGQNGAYANLGVKVMSYLLIQQVSGSVRKTFHQTQLELSGQRQIV